MKTQPHLKQTHLTRATRVIARVTLALSLSSPLAQRLNASPRPASVAPLKAIAPYPKHCLDERQWRDPLSAHPLNLFDATAGSLWVPCEYALRDQGYTVRFPLSRPIKLNGLKITQALTAQPAEGSKEAPKARRLIKRLQVLFFNSKLSEAYPIYFQEVLFDGQASVSVRYAENLDWNPILLSDPRFDERRRALGLSSTELTLPLEVDGVGVVFWELGEGEAPAALESLELSLNQKLIPIDLKSLRAARQEQAIGFASIYPQLIEGYLLMGEARSLVFAKTGTLWGMEGEEEEPKVMGRWRFHQHRLEVALGDERALKRAERKKRLTYVPLHSIMDEAPDRLWLKHPRLEGEYQVSVMAPHEPPSNLLGEPAQVLEGQPVKLKARKAKPDAERPPTFKPLD